MLALLNRKRAITFRELREGPKCCPMESLEDSPLLGLVGLLGRSNRLFELDSFRPPLRLFPRLFLIPVFASLATSWRQLCPFNRTTKERCPFSRDCAPVLRSKLAVQSSGRPAEFASQANSREMCSSSRPTQALSLSRREGETPGASSSPSRQLPSVCFSSATADGLITSGSLSLRGRRFARGARARACR